MGRINVAFIAPFMSATEKVFADMLGMTLRRVEVYEKTNYVMFGGISGVIGISGAISGTAAVSLPDDTAVDLIERLIGEPVHVGVVDETVRDGVGELINLIAGHAKAALSAVSGACNLTLPTIVTGRGHELYRRTGTRCITVVFETQDGRPFTVEVCVPDSA